MTVRVRFAPSPTGSLHIGSVRTILYNAFFAQQNAGTLILRIEDTDQDRLVPGAVESIYDGLHWIGVRWAEGPREGGPFGPYVQSERLALYQEHARQLVDSGDAYPCFCSPERLAQMRAAQRARGDAITKYDRFCRNVPPAEAAERASRERHVIRQKVPDEGVIGIDDLVYGHIEWPLHALEDQVLLKSDGFPTYHLAVVVDDHLMQISHVFRGEDWLPSTPKHLLVYRAFGWEVPPHAHVPNVLGPDGKKLAKRHGATKVEQFRADGFLPEALVNYLSLVGWAPGTEEEIFSFDDLVAKWRMDQVQRAGGKWDRDRLLWFNGVWIRRLSDDELLTRLDPFLPAEWDRSTVRAAIPAIKERIQLLAEAKELLAFLFTDDLPSEAAQYVPKKKTAAEARDAVGRARDALRSAAAFEKGAIEGALHDVAAGLGWKQGDVNMAVRLAVTGSSVGPPIYESIELLGRDRALARLDRAFGLLG